MADSVDQHVDVWVRELPWLDPVKEEIFARLAKLVRLAAESRHQVLPSGGLKRWQFKVLLMLRRVGPPYSASPSDLADMLGLTRGALSARLAPLEEAGLITRTADADDRRRVHVQLTPAGFEAFEQQVSFEDDAERAMLSALTPEEQRTLADLLRTLLEAAESDQQYSDSAPTHAT